MQIENLDKELIELKFNKTDYKIYNDKLNL
jgi:hypothetical protein